MKQEELSNLLLGSTKAAKEIAEGKRDIEIPSKKGEPIKIRMDDKEPIQYMNMMKNYFNFGLGSQEEIICLKGIRAYIENVKNTNIQNMLTDENSELALLKGQRRISLYTGIMLTSGLYLLINIWGGMVGALGSGIRFFQNHRKYKKKLAEISDEYAKQKEELGSEELKKALEVNRKELTDILYREG